MHERHWAIGHNSSKEAASVTATARAELLTCPLSAPSDKRENDTYDHVIRFSAVLPAPNKSIWRNAFYPSQPSLFSPRMAIGYVSTTGTLPNWRYSQPSSFPLTPLTPLPLSSGGYQETRKTCRYNLGGPETGQVRRSGGYQCNCSIFCSAKTSPLPLVRSKYPRCSMKFDFDASPWSIPLGKWPSFTPSGSGATFNGLKYGERQKSRWPRCSRWVSFCFPSPMLFSI